jgi:hypothetical protein
MNKKSVTLHCTCGNENLLFAEPLTEQTEMTCSECGRKFVFSELRDRIALEAYDPEAALTLNDAGITLRLMEIRQAGITIEPVDRDKA